MEILVLNEKNMSDVITMKEVIEADKEALEIYSKGGSVVPLRVNIDVDDESSQSLYMPGFASDANALGVKIVSVYPKNMKKNIPVVPSTMVLLNEETGEVCCLMDGTYLTQIRTGAVSGAATDLLANKDSEIFLLIGTGGQAESQLEAILEIRNIKKVYVFDINLDRTNAFVEKVSTLFCKKYNVEILATPSVDEITPLADIITCVTTSKKPVFDANKIKKGVHINGVGSYTPQMQEIPSEILQVANCIYVDTKDGVLNESGDFIIPIQEGKFEIDNNVHELGELISGQTRGRENKDDITFFETTGTAVLDIVVAKKIYDNSVKKNIGQKINL